MGPLEQMEEIERQLLKSGRVRRIAGDFRRAIVFRDGTDCHIKHTKRRWAQLADAKFMFDGGAPETVFRDTFNTSVGIKYFAICTLDKRYPRLRILARCIAGRLHVPTLHFRVLQKLRLDSRTTQKIVGAYLMTASRLAKKNFFDLYPIFA